MSAYPIENQKKSSCDGKVAFPSMQAAKASLVKKYHLHGVVAYHCGICKKYHVGSNKLYRGRQLLRAKKNKDLMEEV